MPSAADNPWQLQQCPSQHVLLAGKFAGAAAVGHKVYFAPEGNVESSQTTAAVADTPGKACCWSSLSDAKALASTRCTLHPLTLS